MANKKIKKPKNVNITPKPIDPEKSLQLIAAIANRLLEDGHWKTAATKALSGKAELNSTQELRG